jgi:hypothetical protein
MLLLETYLYLTVLSETARRVWFQNTSSFSWGGGGRGGKKFLCKSDWHKETWPPKTVTKENWRKETSFPNSLKIRHEHLFPGHSVKPKFYCSWVLFLLCSPNRLRRKLELRWRMHCKHVSWRLALLEVRGGNANQQQETYPDDQIYSYHPPTLSANVLA